MGFRTMLARDRTRIIRCQLPIAGKVVDFRSDDLRTKRVELKNDKKTHLMFLTSPYLDLECETSNFLDRVKVKLKDLKDGNILEVPISDITRITDGWVITPAVSQYYPNIEVDSSTLLSDGWKVNRSFFEHYLKNSSYPVIQLLKTIVPLPLLTNDMLFLTAQLQVANFENPQVSKYFFNAVNELKLVKACDEELATTFPAKMFRYTIVLETDSGFFLKNKKFTKEDLEEDCDLDEKTKNYLKFLNFLEDFDCEYNSEATVIFVMNLLEMEFRKLKD
jgi:hypothetical protein